MVNSYKISIDTGGTFTDCIATDAHGKMYRRKVLSSSSLRGEIQEWSDPQTIRIVQSWNLEKDILKGYDFKLLGDNQNVRVRSFDVVNSVLVLENPIEVPQYNAFSFELSAGEEAPVLGARLITHTALGEAFPPLQMKLGSTKGTNALLEMKGAKTAFFVTKGFKDLLRIGNQSRPDIFALNIIKPDPLYHEVIEVDEQIDKDGNVLRSIDSREILKNIAYLQAIGIESVAICFKNAYQNNIHEREVGEILREHFRFVSISTILSPQIKLLNRAETAVVNAYLSPVINSYLSNILDKLPENALQVMTSSGSLVRSDYFQPKDSLFSGPAGGVVGASVIAKRSGYEQLITFDMGGTSTDVARYDRKFDYQFSQKIGNAHIFSPALAIETVAAGGGSICDFDGFKLTVGPESAGSNPGPACYGAGGPLTITDVNLLLGRIDIQQFSIPVFVEKAAGKLQELIRKIEETSGKQVGKEEVLEGFRSIANEKMAEAVRKISIAKGYDTKEYALLAFGGAGGLHACGIAGLLNISTVILPEDAGILSAFGISEAGIERITEKSILSVLTENTFIQIQQAFEKLSEQAIEKLIQEGLPEKNIEIKRKILFLRFKGQDASLEIEWNDYQSIVENFKRDYQKTYGHWVENREIEVESVRVIASEKREDITGNAEKSRDPEVYSTAQPSHFLRSLVEGSWIDVPVFLRESLKTGSLIKGFAVLLDKFSTTVIEKGFELRIDKHGTSIIENKPAEQPSKTVIEASQETELELFTNRFMAIADNMGVMLQRTSLSVNVKERLDFSCALLDSTGELIANAPHIPVHLGSLGVCVRSLKKHISMEEGDVVITNHPKYGGSHLPDVTLVSPVFSEDKQLIGYVVNRCHHAEIGGIRPASMPPDATNLAQEGVVINPAYLVKNHKVLWENIKDILTQNPFPTRAVEENLADLNAALAANKNGAESLKELVRNYGLEKVHFYMELLKSYSAKKMRETLNRFDNGIYKAEEFLDDGTNLNVSVQISDNECIIDFSGSGNVHPGNLNGNEAIVNSVVIYVLRLLLNRNIPLNDGILRPVKIIIPEKTLLNPDFPDDPAKCPAVVGGNVELSQRLTDTLLKAFGVLACSQGTMNNVLFGNQKFGYYETICGGSGAGEGFNGASGVHTHMTNTRITDPEIFELRYPVRLDRFEIRENSGGAGKYKGGNGIEREITFLEDIQLSILTQHRYQLPYGMKGGFAGKTGEQFLKSAEGIRTLKGIEGIDVKAGETLLIKTPGGGGFGKSEI
ncbi:5-oxoprolinase (ATP-hydrolysing) [Pseudarcicella hirudinis]|uniref:5-oxoprolinase (ATP-hydrolysing) n=1 Tax=Pseudarcicella hirudinis TaxID=1079859 RepID=A0A1I5W8A0_9BACT|nr:hydantoinase B/oxoprolinase family protein [Pseudarcicella hirudinis]SFQ15881.1 5-oxoprolinase (ATP-hydrolysing) [Pseudarcicella hirudinis]